MLSKDEHFFTLMEGSAEEARRSILSLIEVVKTAEEKRSLEGFVQSRRKEKRLTEQLTEHLCKTFMTPLEREDIEALSAALYKIPKTAEKFAERLLLAPQHVRGLQLKRQMGMLEMAADTVLRMVKELRKGVNLETVKSQNAQLQQIEGEADELMLEILRELYNGDHGATHLVFQKDLFELLEKVFDRCRDVGNIVFHIVLKNS